jgi:hypothetical protein
MQRTYSLAKRERVLEDGEAELCRLPRLGRESNRLRRDRHHARRLRQGVLLLRKKRLESLVATLRDKLNDETISTSRSLERDSTERFRYGDVHGGGGGRDERLGEALEEVERTGAPFFGGGREGGEGRPGGMLVRLAICVRVEKGVAVLGGKDEAVCFGRGRPPKSNSVAKELTRVVRWGVEA